MTDRQETPPDPSIPLFTIGTVSRRVGISAPALRMWEERYGTVSPLRDGHGRRLYSEQQIEDLTWIRAAIDNGLTASEAHRMLATRRDTRPMEASLDPGTSFREWVLSDHDWLAALCAEMVDRMDGVILTYVGVHESIRAESGRSWLLVSCVDEELPAWFTGSAHSVARVHRLSNGNPVFFSHGRGREQITETAVPVMVDGSWMAAVALAWRGGRNGDGVEALEAMEARVRARYEAWAAYSRFEELTRPGPASDTPAPESA